MFSQFYPYNDPLYSNNYLHFTVELPVTSLEQYYDLLTTWDFLKKYDPIYSLCKATLCPEYLNEFLVDGFPLFLCCPNESITIYTKDKVYVEEDLLLEDFQIVDRKAWANSDKEARRVLNEWHTYRTRYHIVWNENDSNKSALMFFAQRNASGVLY